YAFLNPMSGRLAVFGGYGEGVFKNTLWEYDQANQAWAGQPQSDARPEPRFGHRSSGVAIDAAHARAFLGQRSLGTAEGNYDDLWKLDLRTNSWTNLIPAYTTPDARIGS